MRDWINSDDALEVFASIKDKETKLIIFVEGFWKIKKEGNTYKTEYIIND